MTASSTTGFGIRSGQMATGRVQSRQHGNRSASFAAWFVLLGIIIPTAELHPKITPARLVIWLLLVPAITRLHQRGRRLLVSDLFACATAGWMMVALTYNEGVAGLTTSGAAEAIDFFGGYVVARAFFRGSTALGTFIQVLKVFAAIAIILGMADTISGHLFIHQIFSSIVGYAPPGEQVRHGLVRANSSFDHAILFGAFCAAVAAILLYSERSALGRSFWAGLCCLGVILSLTSAALMAIFISLAVYTYDGLLRQYRWRWSLFWIFLIALAVILFFASDNPIGWVVLHLTMEPQNGYYRFLIWGSALPKIAQSPYVGYAFQALNNEVLDATVDSVWLVSALRYGVPTVVFLFLANITALLPTHGSFDSKIDDPYMKRTRTGFTVALIMFMLMGLTVHYWSFVWSFWGLCIGLRASFREQSIVTGRVRYHGSAALAS